MEPETSMSSTTRRGRLLRLRRASRNGSPSKRSIALTVLRWSSAPRRDGLRRSDLRVGGVGRSRANSLSSCSRSASSRPDMSRLRSTSASLAPI